MLCECVKTYSLFHMCFSVLGVFFLFFFNWSTGGQHYLAPELISVMCMDDFTRTNKCTSHRAACHLFPELEEGILSFKVLMTKYWITIKSPPFKVPLKQKENVDTVSKVWVVFQYIITDGRQIMVFSLWIYLLVIFIFVLSFIVWLIIFKQEEIVQSS